MEYVYLIILDEFEQKGQNFNKFKGKLKFSMMKTDSRVLGMKSYDNGENLISISIILLVHFRKLAVTFILSKISSYFFLTTQQNDIELKGMTYELNTKII